MQCLWNILKLVAKRLLICDDVITIESKFNGSHKTTPRKTCKYEINANFMDKVVHQILNRDKSNFSCPERNLDLGSMANFWCREPLRVRIPERGLIRGFLLFSLHKYCRRFGFIKIYPEWQNIIIRYIMAYTCGALTLQG